MLCLGIEGTAHTVGIGIAEARKILANVSKVYIPKDGIHPREAANAHAKNILPVLQEALKKADVDIKELELVAFSQGPGLGPCLRTVATAARALSLSLKIPIIGVNHCIAHLEIGRSLTKCRDPVLLYVSGGNTQVISFSNSKYRVFGETLDIGIGNLLDKFGRIVGLPFPCGPEIERQAKKGTKLIDLPYSIKGMDVAFSGILTAALHLINIEKLEDICYSLQETTFAMLTEVTERAMAHLDKKEILLGGGVACNKRLQEMLDDMCKSRGAKLFVPAPQFCVDNGAMIALTGLLMYKSGIRMKIEDSEIKQRFRTDDVDVRWR
ncbi:MAG: bifunctional N(6)-L-threonylcarbamoyladenine synthase/serine/threonine protein kinase [Candidatus Thermoplasmatota archaeon]|nr:bifunctional N(6)-L-threonylcarbamoyladenine synthase/serine/threonine protein kinase [Candidatus Thermoplasmatota archaeon]